MVKRKYDQTGMDDCFEGGVMHLKYIFSLLDVRLDRYLDEFDRKEESLFEISSCSQLKIKKSWLNLDTVYRQERWLAQVTETGRTIQNFL